MVGGGVVGGGVVGWLFMQTMWPVYQDMQQQQYLVLV